MGIYELNKQLQDFIIVTDNSRFQPAIFKYSANINHGNRPDGFSNGILASLPCTLCLTAVSLALSYSEIWF